MHLKNGANLLNDSISILCDKNCIEWERPLEDWSCERQNVMNGAGRVRFFIVDSDLADMSTEGIEQGRLERWRKHVEQENTYWGSQHTMTDSFGKLLWGPGVHYSGKWDVKSNLS